MSIYDAVYIWKNFFVFDEPVLYIFFISLFYDVSMNWVDGAGLHTCIWVHIYMCDIMCVRRGTIGMCSFLFVHYIYPKKG